MDYANPTLLIISGPNGAGKSTFIQSLLPEAFHDIIAFDRDKTRTAFEAQLRGQGTPAKDITPKATRMMEAVLENEMNEAIATKKHFVLETPLSHPDYWQYIDRFEKNGYQVQLNYLCLDSIRACKFRVEQRVREGGHHVDARTIKGVYEMNLQYINDYLSSFKIVELYDGMITPNILVKMEDGQIVLAKEGALKKHWIKSGLPVIAQKTVQFLEVVKRNQKNEKTSKSKP